MDYAIDKVADVAYVQVAQSVAYAQRGIVHTVPSQPGANLILAQFEATNPLPYNVGLGRYIVRSDGARIAPATMDNITPEMHHRVVSLAAWDRQPVMGATYSLVVYAVSMNAKAGDSIRIEQGYGFLDATGFTE